MQWKARARIDRQSEEKWFHITFADLADQQLFPCPCSFALRDLLVRFAVVEVLQIVVPLFVQTEGQENKGQDQVDEQDQDDGREWTGE